jgi:hypothetical protein
MNCPNDEFEAIHMTGQKDACHDQTNVCGLTTSPLQISFPSDVFSLAFRIDRGDIPVARDEPERSLDQFERLVVEREGST